MKTLLFMTLLALLQPSKSYTDISLSTLLPSQGISIISLNPSGLLGSSVKNAGDFNGDGFDDILIGAYAENSGTGAVYIVFGSPSGLSNLDVTSGFGLNEGVVIYGAGGGDQFGYSVSSAGDINDDGIGDIIIGADSYNSVKGAAYVIYGSKTLPSAIDLSQGLSTSQGFAVTGGSNSDYLGSSVSFAGDVNNDKIDDIIIGASGVSTSKGAAYVIFGKKGIRSHMNMASGLGPTEGFAVLGATGGDSLGKSVSNAGDIDGDGIEDIIIGAPAKGAVYVIYGKEKTSIFGTINLSSGLSGSQGFIMTGAPQFGFSVSAAGDFNGDGKDDVVVGSYAEDSVSGAAYIIFGKARTSLLDFTLSSGVDPSRALRISTTSSMEFLGMLVSGAGDINNDGIDDVIISGPRGNSLAGVVYVIFGSKSLASTIAVSSGLGPDEGFRIHGDQPGDFLGGSVSYAGDLNGDGMADIVLGAHGVNVGCGAGYLLFSALVCPEKCSTCETAKKCLTCKAGYGLLDNEDCVICPSSTELVNGICKPSSSLGPAAQVAHQLFNSGSTTSRLFTMGRSLSVGLGLIAKIIQNARFLDIDYPEEALEAFKTYGTDLFQLPIPEAFYESPETKELPSQYARYDMEPSFLENYWDTIMMILVSLGLFLGAKLLQLLTKGQGKGTLFQTALKNIAQTFANFFIIQIYANLDDVVFYLLLDIQSTKMNSSSAGISMGVALIFLVIGLALVFFHCWLLSKYQQAKSQDALERFEAKYRVLGTLYEDFKDDSIAKHSFFGILILRCIILILVIVLLQPQWMQGTLLMITNLAFWGYFIYYRPFRSRFDEVCQYFCEFTVFAAYLCVLILSILDAQDVQKSSLRNGLGKCIVIAGIVLALGGFIIQMIQIIGAIIGIYMFFKNHSSQKDLQVTKLDQSTTANRLSENSSILRHGSPDRFELPHILNRNSRISQERLRQNNLEISSFRLDDSALQNNLRDHQRFSMPRQERNSQRLEPRLEVAVRPLGSQIYRQNRERDRLDSYVGSSSPVKRRRIKRNQVFPDLNRFSNY